MMMLARGGLFRFINRAIDGSDGSTGYLFMIGFAVIILVGFWAYKKNRDG